MLKGGGKGGRSGGEIQSKIPLGIEMVICQLQLGSFVDTSPWEEETSFATTQMD